MEAPVIADSARDAALAFIARQAGKYPRLDLAPLDSGALAPRDAAFAHAIVAGVLRRWLTLRALLQTRLAQPFESIEPGVKSALLCGAAQVFLLDRVPAHAAINHAVGWSKRVVRPGAGGLVNAVLRRVAELRAVDSPREPYAGRRDELPMPDGTSLRLREPVFAEPEFDRLAEATGHPRHQLEAWREAHGEQRVRALALHSLCDAPTILRWPAGLTMERAGIEPHECPGFAVFRGTHAELLAILQTRDDVWVQDPASAGAIASIADLRPRFIIDFCAGLGTKTRQLAHTFPDARIVASDTDERRLEALRALAGTRADRLRVVRPERLIDFAGQADLVVLDVPCSNTGVLARRPEAKYRFNRTSIAELTGIQRQIIADALRLLSPGQGRSPPGIILYSTCSLEPVENQAHIAWAREWHRLEPSRERLEFPAGGPGLPDSTYTDGAYSVVLGRGPI
ncbi:MAG: transcription antitermination factor NusB [Phycisphaerales bacterium]